MLHIIYPIIDIKSRSKRLGVQRAGIRKKELESPTSDIFLIIAIFLFGFIWFLKIEFFSSHFLIMTTSSQWVDKALIHHFNNLDRESLLVAKLINHKQWKLTINQCYGWREKSNSVATTPRLLLQHPKDHLS